METSLAGRQRGLVPGGHASSPVAWFERPAIGRLSAPLRLLLEKRVSYLHFLVDWLRSVTTGSLPPNQPHAHIQGRPRRDVVVVVGRVPVFFTCQVLDVQLNIEDVVHGVEQRSV